MTEYILLLHIGPAKPAIRIGYLDERTLKVGDVVPTDTTRRTVLHEGIYVWKVDAIGEDGAIHCVPQVGAAAHGPSLP